MENNKELNFRHNKTQIISSSHFYDRNKKLNDDMLVDKRFDDLLAFFVDNQKCKNSGKCKKI